MLARLAGRVAWHVPQRMGESKTTRGDRVDGGLYWMAGPGNGVLGPADPDRGQPLGDPRLLQVGARQFGQPAAERREERQVGVGAHRLGDDRLAGGRGLRGVPVGEGPFGAWPYRHLVASTEEVEYVKGELASVGGRVPGWVEWVAGGQV